MPTLFAFLHHLAAFVLFAALFTELVLIKGELTAWSARKILRFDLIYGIAAIVVVTIGFLRVTHFEKGAHYYFHSVPFLVKIASFALVGLVSIYPTRQYMRWRPVLKRGEVPVIDANLRRRIASLLHLQLTGLAVILLCAALMAHGVGYFG
jgi:putative membrane protein